MPNQDTQVTKSYAEAIYRRSTQSVRPPGFDVNWADQPLRYKVMEAVTPLPLPMLRSTATTSYAEVLTRLRRKAFSSQSLTEEQFAQVNHLAYGLLTRRLNLDWNGENKPGHPFYHSLYSRGTPSGGGMYPTEMYWVEGANSQFVPGVYHYQSAHHSLDRLYAGNLLPHLSGLVNEPSLASSSRLLVLSLRFWKNSFKYHNFSYHVITMDVGALLASLRLLAASMGVDLPIIYWYPDTQVDKLLGLNTVDESSFAIMPIPSSQTGVLATTPPSLDTPLFTKPVYERSKTLLKFDLAADVHQSALVQDEPRPLLTAAVGYAEWQPVTPSKPLPPIDSTMFNIDTASVFYQRRSSFGRFSSERPITTAQLGQVLYATTALQGYRSDLSPDGTNTYLTRLVVYCNNVAGLNRGVYVYDATNHGLSTVIEADYTTYWQPNYFLHNYNLNETAVIVGIIAKTEAVIDLLGNRGLRVLHAEVGMMTQGLYLATAALGLGCGAVLGFNNININQLFSLGDSKERTLILVMIGGERRNPGHFISEIK